MQPDNWWKMTVIQRIAKGRTCTEAYKELYDVTTVTDKSVDMSLTLLQSRKL